MGIIVRATGRVIARAIASAILPVVSAIIPKLDENLCDCLLIIHVVVADKLDASADFSSDSTGWWSGTLY